MKISKLHRALSLINSLFLAIISIAIIFILDRLLYKNPIIYVNMDINWRLLMHSFLLSLSAIAFSICNFLKNDKKDKKDASLIIGGGITILALLAMLFAFSGTTYIKQIFEFYDYKIFATIYWFVAYALVTLVILAPKTKRFFSEIILYLSLTFSTILSFSSISYFSEIGNSFIQTLSVIMLVVALLLVPNTIALDIFDLVTSSKTSTEDDKINSSLTGNVNKENNGINISVVDTINNEIDEIFKEVKIHLKPKKVECQYCGSRYNSDKDKCPYCGANNKK